MKAPRGTAISSIWFSFLFFSANANDSLRVSRRNKGFDEPHRFVTYGECNKNFLNSFGKVIMKTLCKPRPKAVEIIHPSSHMLIIPSKVIVNRCDGMCHAKQSCYATEKKTVQVMIQQMNLLETNGMPQCGVVHVEEHLRCKCKCTVMKEDCNEKQVYQPGECMCLCMNLDDKRKCIREGKSWDEETCSCMCPTKKECTTPLVWLPEYCRCAKLMNEDETRDN